MDPVGISVLILSFMAVAAQTSDHKCAKPKLENGRFYSSMSDLPINRVVRYRCDKGYVLANKTGRSYGTTKCTETGWDPEPKCLGPCFVSEKDMDANDIRVDFPLWWRWVPSEHGERISFRCAKGYGISDSSLLRVQCNNGVIPYPKCTKLEGCGPPPVVLQGETVQDRMKSYEHGSILTYKCPLYYTLEGNQNITCRNGLWDDPPVCQEPCTLSEDDMKANGIRRGSFFWRRVSILQHGDSVLFGCVQGYEKSTEFSLRVECNNGVIPYPKCTELESCGSPPVVTYGETVQGRMKSYGHGTVMTYQCLQYYTLEGNRNVTCRNGKWDDPPVCREPCVVTSKDIEESKLLRIFTKEQYVPNGDYVTFICLEGCYKLHRVQCHRGIMAYPKCSRQE